ncbi:MAG TPA: hypothetical protein VJ461_06280 [Candidatus Nanoarchaeia archaeon]|nr:hypothetical protein [Candidatus Nanoarchaeia archaeon]
MKKGQAAMEFLMTYGWAILVVLAAIGALAYFGVLSPDRFLPSKCMISGGFSCVEYKLDGSVPGAQVVKLYVQNNLGVDAQDVTVNLTDNSGTACTSSDDSNLFPTPTGIDNGIKEGPILFDGGCNLGDKSFRGTITVTYQKSEETETHTATGTLSGRFED